MAATFRWTLGGTAVTPIGYERSRRSWSVYNCCCKLLSAKAFLAQSKLVPYKWQTPRRTHGQAINLGHLRPSEGAIEALVMSYGAVTARHIWIFPP